MERIKEGDIVLHFKGNKYEVLNTHIYWHEDHSRLVMYQSLKDHKICVRPYDMFCSAVDRQKYPDVTQKYRFEVISRPE